MSYDKIIEEIDLLMDECKAEHYTVKKEIIEREKDQFINGIGKRSAEYWHRNIYLQGKLGESELQYATLEKCRQIVEKYAEEK